MTLQRLRSLGGAVVHTIDLLDWASGGANADNMV